MKQLCGNKPVLSRQPLMNTIQVGNIVIEPKTWRYVFDAIEVPVFLHDTEFRVLLANRAYCREAGLTEAEALGKPYWEVFPRGAGPLPACKDAVIAKGHDSSEEEVRVGAKHYLSRGYKVLDDQGKSLYSLHILSEITERNRALASEERYRRLFESAKDGILILDAETGMVVDANPFITELLGYSHKDCLGKHIWDLGFLKNIAANKNKFLELQQQDYVRYEDLPLETAQGQTVHVEFVSNVYLVGNIRVIQCNIRDITRRWLAEEKSLRLGQMYRTISKCNEALVRASDELGLTKKMCRVLTEEGNFCMAWVGYAGEGEDKSIKMVAMAGIKEGIFPAWAR